MNGPTGSRTYQPPTLPESPSPDLNTRFKTLAEYWTRKFFPYLFDYLTSVTALDQIRCNAELVSIAPGGQNGVNTDFLLADGPIRLAPDGTPQAVLAVGSLGGGVAQFEYSWVPLVGLRNGVNQNFTIAVGNVALGPNGNPLAWLFQGGSNIPYTTGIPGPSEWTMSGQTFILGTPPTGAPTDEPIVSSVIVQ